MGSNPVIHRWVRIRLLLTLEDYLTKKEALIGSLFGKLRD